MTALANAAGVRIDRGLTSSSTRRTIRSPAAATAPHMAGPSASTGVVPGSAMPSASAARCMELAVPMPAQTPAPVTAERDIWPSSSTVIRPALTCPANRKMSSKSTASPLHGMSRPIGAHFHVPHGLSNAMLLPAITRFSVGAAEARYAEAARRIGFANDRDADGTATAKLVTGLEALNKDLAVQVPPNTASMKRRGMARWS